MRLCERKFHPNSSVEKILWSVAILLEFFIFLEPLDGTRIMKSYQRLQK